MSEDIITLDTIGERGLLRRLLPRLPTNGQVVLGAGDDAAIVQGGEGWDLVLTSDAVIEGRHFLDTDAPARVGHKALARALSDLAAMGAEPLWALVDLVAPGNTPLDNILRMYAGMNALADKFGLAIIGGDTTESTPLALHVFAGGRLPGGTARRRDGARPHDRLMVTGSLGGSLAGRHLDFSPRLLEGRFLRDHVNAMIDLSDGLASDARHLGTASKVGIRLDAASIPCAPHLGALPRREALQHALADGEDFELLASVAPAKVDYLLKAWAERFPDLPLTPIGIVTDQTGKVVLCDEGKYLLLGDNGFDHFDSRTSLNHTITTNSERETWDAAASLAADCAGGGVIALHGDMGSGKTTFAQGLARALGVREPVTSPTFALVNRYSGACLTLVHIDLYRLVEPEELDTLDFDELLEAPDSLIIIEWPDLADNRLPATTRHVYLELTSQPSVRRIRLQSPRP